MKIYNIKKGYLLLMFPLLTLCIFNIGYSKTVNESTSIKGYLYLGVVERHVEAKLEYKYVPIEAGISEVSFYLTNDVEIDELHGHGIKDYSFSKENAQIPFGILTVEFKEQLEIGQAIEFTLSYSGRSTKGFWPNKYKWIDIDPDFMILPSFTDYHTFDYEIKARVNDSDYKFVDAKNQQMTSRLNVEATSANYFSSIVAGSEMNFNQFTEGSYTVNIISNKADSVVNYLGNKSLEILKFFNNTIGEKKKVNSFSVLYRPMPDSIFRTMRNLTNDRLIMFTHNHDLIHTLAHEVSHFWWNRGNDYTMEKWLDESFAQYSELLYVRHTEGLEKFQEKVNHLEKESQRLPSLLKSDRFGKNWSDILYVKGPYLLYQLEEVLGKEKFMLLLSNLNEVEVSNTEEMLNELEKISNSEVRNMFYQKLNE
ncbi:hypothetical protein LZF95_21270 [Algoriphagus sp. AGSA1]|uniref:M1 family aminopeptidase n=1 Tax=Algoriphagus sp. AGSA1 TaxID=2907213 RepID=UPI001F16D9AD|nr:M1 family aminopeptidase [Algoriphagus sp. AGSA1]MCE7057226.1 hypothetical protein [Algoriphagus sp. AGSA1]